MDARKLDFPLYYCEERDTESLGSSPRREELVTKLPLFLTCEDQEKFPKGGRLLFGVGISGGQVLA